MDLGFYNAGLGLIGSQDAYFHQYLAENNRHLQSKNQSCEHMELEKLKSGWMQLKSESRLHYSQQNSPKFRQTRPLTEHNTYRCT